MKNEKDNPFLALVLALLGSHDPPQNRAGLDLFGVRTGGEMTGSQFFDETKKLALADAVSSAAAIYARRNGKQPTVCLVSNRQYSEPPPIVAGVTVRAVGYVMPNHFWAGE